jgi:hypothetical protein
LPLAAGLRSGVKLPIVMRNLLRTLATSALFLVTAAAAHAQVGFDVEGYQYPQGSSTDHDLADSSCSTAHAETNARELPIPTCVRLDVTLTCQGLVCAVAFFIVLIM